LRVTFQPAAVRVAWPSTMNVVGASSAAAAVAAVAGTVGPVTTVALALCCLLPAARDVSVGRRQALPASSAM
jgi:hypothetical protein